ncbi:MAG: hypothetical protein KJ876_07310 [Alphaproteobacteria bacterium]|nr:hypothetical protein [Alphaproteobacteria bacterium]MBU0867938.1 hypothetical protein [Alphaproteobacteria bacterium]MBU1259519.1 hypothetical protein [Alphaproteobacteria bacterium]MBU1462204.1 hypothetical protein [Alphaproteobacteria bacterium]MBU1795828.1 hypothetical protein [Alphaproteobacteria bacterium]
MKLIGACLAAALLLTPGIAKADDASAWSKYERRVDGILDALHSAWRTGETSDGTRQRVKALCQGVTQDSTGGGRHNASGLGAQPDHGMQLC